MKLKTGLQPRDFAWVIRDRLATSSRIGGQGIQHRRVRRQEEVAWLRQNGFTAVVSLLPGTHNVKSYEDAGFEVFRAPVEADPDPPVIERAFDTIHRALVPQGDTAPRVLVHRDFVDDTVAGILAGYIVFAGLVKDQRLAVIAIQQIIGRPLGSSGRALIPTG